MTGKLASVCATIFLSTGLCEAQQMIKLFYDKDWRITSSDLYLYRREAHFNLQAANFDGEYRDYDHDDHLIAQGTYKNGVKTGVHMVYFPDGTLKSSITFSDNEFSIDLLLDDQKVIMVKDGTGKFTVPYTLLKKARILRGAFLNHKREGEWTYGAAKGDIVSNREIYKDGELAVNLRSMGPFGSQLTQKHPPINLFQFEATESFEMSADPTHSIYEIIGGQLDLKNDSTTALARLPNGISAFNSFVVKNFKIEKVRAFHSGRVIVKISIDKKGNVTQTEVLKSAYKALDLEALRIVKLLDKRWLPAVLKGQPYDSQISLPVAFDEVKTIRM